MPNSTASYLWRDRWAAEGFRTGVSLHSHAHQSRDTLDLLADLGNQHPWNRPAGSCPDTTKEEMRSRSTGFAHAAASLVYAPIAYLLPLVASSSGCKDAAMVFMASSESSGSDSAGAGSVSGK